MTETKELPARETLPRRKIGTLQIGTTAVYYRDGMEMGWVKLDEQNHFPVEIKPPRWEPIGKHEPFNPDEEVSVIQNTENNELSKFAVEVHKDTSIDEMRKDAKEKFGREIHIRAKIGPTVIDEGGKGLTCPIESVDDPCLLGEFNQWPQQADHYLLVGHFK